MEKLADFLNAKVYVLADGPANKKAYSVEEMQLICEEAVNKFNYKPKVVLENFT